MTRNRIVDRWKEGQGKIVLDRLYEFFGHCSKQGHRLGPPDFLPLLNGLPLREEVANGRDLRGINLGITYDFDFRGFDFSWASLMNMYHCDFSGAKFDRATIEGGFHGTMIGASFVLAKLRNCGMEDSIATNCCFDQADLYHAHCQRTNFQNSSFKKAKCRGTVLIGANLIGCNFQKANLAQAIICEAKLDKTTDFRGARLTDMKHDAWRDRAGNILNQGVDWRQATWDETTEI